MLGQRPRDTLMLVLAILARILNIEKHKIKSWLAQQSGSWDEGVKMEQEIAMIMEPSLFFVYTAIELHHSNA